MQSIKLELKYSLYGLVVGAMAMVISHSLCFAIAAIDIHHIAAVLAITAIALLVYTFIGKILQTSELTRYLQKKVYCLVFFLSALWSGTVYWVFFAPSVVDVLASVSPTVYQFGLLFLAGTIFICLFCISRKNKEEKTGDINIYLSDQEIEKSEDDRFFGGQVKQFANDLEMYSSPVVFGIEGPWGIGKSSFSNLCCEQLEKDLNNKLVIYKFNPLSYDDIDKVLKNFYTGLIAAIKKKYFEPEVEALLESYMEKVISSLSEQSIQLIKIKIAKTTIGTEQMMKKLEKSLANLDYQIFIVIDDLDRLDFATIKKIFFMMRNVFPFPNLKFIVCYDFEAITQSVKMSGHAPKDAAFWLENFINKYINRTYRIYWKNEQAIQFVHQYAEGLLKRQYVQGLNLWRICGQAVYEICEGEMFSRYQVFLGTPRKIKTLFQQLLRISNTKQYQNAEYDFNGLDIVHLLLIYMYYPSDFRKIYDMETRGISGFYSYSPIGKNEEEHIKYLEGEMQELSCEEKELFKQLFLQENILKNYKNNYSRACFNEKNGNLFAGSEGALARYLNLITLSEIPEENDSYGIYESIFEKEILKCETVDAVGQVFSGHSDIEHLAENLWPLIVFHLDDLSFYDRFSNELLEALALYAAKQLENYKLKTDIISFRTKLIVYIKIFLNKLAQRYSNQAVNREINQAVKILFNEDAGVLHYLLCRNSNNLALMDLFDALYLKGVIDIRTEGNDIFALNDALIRAAESPKGLLNGNNTDKMAKIELRKISQRIYHFFSKKFRNRNLWDEFNNLPLSNIFEFNSELPQEEQVIEQQSALFGLRIFILSQVGNKERGLAGYDVEGSEDNSGIRSDFSQYLVNHCFLVNKNNTEEYKRYFNFVEFMLISIMNGDAWSFDRMKHDQKTTSSIFIVSPEGLTCLMAPKDLKDYWLENRENIIKSINTPLFNGKKFYVNHGTVLDAKYAAGVICHSLKYWTSKEQNSRWDNLS
ncbi:P-loop NTPase fold protein [uncultured Megasphaera sp.]|uniref:P-loop NTPase fold protein n=1 Tax=uncultured Megasphaera sp. TaxID=165188 RepID=UPI0025FD117F|nr:P-loop NTPase fold protein [uncultured Megasphaera sp.]